MKEKSSATPEELSSVEGVNGASVSTVETAPAKPPPQRKVEPTSSNACPASHMTEPRQEAHSQAGASSLVTSEAGPRPLQSDAGPLERLHLLSVLKDVTTRLGTLEASLSKQSKPETKPAGHFFLEFCKILLGGWPAFGFLFLLLFYSPLRDALGSIPEKVKAADEIQLAGMSLKSTIKKVAATQGLGSLGETIPKLSSPALELLLRAPRRGASLVSFRNADDRQHYSAINFPSDQIIKALAELRENGLVTIEGGLGKDSDPLNPLDKAKLEQLAVDFKKQLPGSLSSLPGEREIEWKLDAPVLPDAQPLPRLWWTLTDSGAQAVDVVLKAVSTALASSPEKESK